ncbi:hypothetical protein Tco_0561344 [Tanacetum coccineum]
MSNLKFAETHNLVAFLEKPKESDGFEGIIDFLNASSIRYALMVNPTIYTSYIKQFWATDKAKTVNGEIQALVDGKKVIVTKMSVRRALQLKDAEVLRLLLGTNSVALWPQLSSVLPQTKNSTFPKAKGFSRRVTPLFQTMMVQAQEKGEGSEMPINTEVSQPSDPTQPMADETKNVESVHIHSNDPLLSGEDRLKLNELLELCIKLSKRVLDLENTKTSQATEITKLKERVKKLERKNKSRTLRLRILRKEDASKQGRKIDDIDADEEEVKVEKVVSTAKVTTASDTTTTVDELTLAQTLIEIKAAKPKAVTIATTTATTVVTRPKARGVVVQEPSEFTTTTSQPSQFPQAKDKGKGKWLSLKSL